jgi:hypothetical protein
MRCKFIAYPDASQAGQARFLRALADLGGKVHRSASGVAGGFQFLIEVEDRERFAELAGTPTRPIVTEDAPAARVPARRRDTWVPWVRADASLRDLERFLARCDPPDDAEVP